MSKERIKKMSQIEKEIGHNIGKGTEYASMAKKGVEEGLGSLGRLIGAWRDESVWVPVYDREGGVSGWRRSWDPKYGARPGVWSQIKGYLRK